MDPAGTLTTLRPIGGDARPGLAAAVVDLGGRPAVLADLGGAPHGGGFTAEDADVVVRAVDDAREGGLPFVALVRGLSVHPPDGVAALDGWGRVARALADASGVVPTVAVLDGPCLTGLSLCLGLCDVVVATPAAVAFVCGPSAVAATTGRTLDGTALGGTAVHTGRSGLAALPAPDLGAALDLVADVLDHLPANNLDAPPVAAAPTGDDRRSALGELVPLDPRHAYDVRDVVAEVVDDAGLLELGAGFGGALVCGLARLGGHPVGIVANQPGHLAGAIDIESSQKAARFVQWCDAFGLPLVTFVDTPGYLPGRDIEWDGMIRFGGQLAFAYAAATVPRLCVILRKAYGGAYIVMDSKSMGNDLCVAWPRAEVAVMGAAGAVQILHGRALAGLPVDDEPQRRAELEAEYGARYLHPGEAASRGYVDAVIEPAATREVLVAALPTLAGKRRPPPARKHRNGPL